MSAGVLFDAPGPKTVVRHRAYSLLAVAAVLGLLAFVCYRLWVEDQFAYAKWEPFLTPRYVQAILVDGLLTTLQMAGAAVVLAMIFGLAFGVGKLSDHRVARWPSALVVEIFRAIPVLLLMIFAFLIWGIDRGSSGPFWSVVIALMLYNGAVLAEVFRAGVQAVPAGQAEAAYAIGMRKSQVMVTILLPQAVKIMLPALISQMVVAVKDTSLGFAVAAPGLTAVGNLVWLEFNNMIPTVIVLAALYISVNLILTVIATWVQKRLSGDKKSSTTAVLDIEAAKTP